MAGPVRASRAHPAVLVAVVVLALAALALTACGSGDDAATSPGNELTPDRPTETSDSINSEGATRVVDTPRGKVEIPTDPQRIAVLWRPTLASMLQLGIDPVATSGGTGGDPSFLEGFFPEGYPIQDLAIIGEARSVNFEALATAKPDLILGADVNYLVDVYDLLSEIAPTVLLTWEGTASWRAMLVDVADVLGVTGRAQEVVKKYEARVSEVRESIGLDENPMTVSLVRVQNPEEIRIETPESFPGQVLADVGFDRPENQLVPDANSDFISLSLERIPEVDAPTIIVTYYFDGDTAPASEQIRTLDLWKALPAVQVGNVIETDYLYWGGSNYYAAHRILDDISEAFDS